jgi:hypothetical protein
MNNEKVLVKTALKRQLMRSRFWITAQTMIFFGTNAITCRVAEGRKSDQLTAAALTIKTSRLHNTT